MSADTPDFRKWFALTFGAIGLIFGLGLNATWYNLGIGVAIWVAAGYYFLRLVILPPGRILKIPVFIIALLLGIWAFTGGLVAYVSGSFV